MRRENVKYILAFLILIGGLIGIFALTALLVYAGEKINNWERDLDWRNKKYRYFKEKILPGMILSVFGAVLITGLIVMYCDILKHFN